MQKFNSTSISDKLGSTQVHVAEIITDFQRYSFIPFGSFVQALKN